MKKTGVGIMLVVMLGSCAPFLGQGKGSHLSKGNAAAQIADWKQAELHYRQALFDEPGNESVQRRHEAARRSAIRDSLTKGTHCLATRDFKCAQAEVAYLYEIDPDNTEASRLEGEIDTQKRERDERLAKRADEAAKARLAARERETIARIDAVLAVAKRGQYLQALRDLSARRTSSDSAKTRARDLAVREEIATYALGRVGSLHKEAQSGTIGARYAALSEATEILALIDTESTMGLLRKVAPEYKRVKTAYAQKQNQEAEELIAAGNWQEAAALLKKASAADPRYATRARYAIHMTTAHVAISGRNFITAVLSLREAIAATPSQAPEARALLTRVEPRSYRITLETVAINPAKPGSSPPKPWVGEPDGMFGTILGIGASFTGVGILMAGKVKKLADTLEKVSYNSRPNVRVALRLPDGREFTTGHDRTLFKTVGASFVVKTNTFDSREVVLTAFHELQNDQVTIGTVQVPLGDIVSDKLTPISEPDHNGLVYVRFHAVPDTAPVGATAGWEKTVNPKNRIKKVPRVLPGGSPFRLQRVHLVLAKKHGDDPFIKIRQGGDVVFKSPWHEDDRDTNWTPNWVFFPQRHETIAVEVWDREAWGSNIKILEWSLTGSRISSGKVTLSAEDGSRLKLVFERVATGPR